MWSLSLLQGVLGILFVLVLVYVLAYIAGSGAGKAFFERKARYNRDLLDELRRSDGDGSKTKDGK